MKNTSTHLIFAVAWALAVGCGGSDDGSGGTAGTPGTGGTGGPTSPLSLDQATAVAATSEVATTASFFSSLGQLVATAIGSLTGVTVAGAEVSSKVDVPLGDVCLSGTAAADWTDGDGDQQLSVGDVVTVTLTDCVVSPDDEDTASGALTIEIVNVNDGRNLFTGDTTLDLAIGDTTVAGTGFQTSIDLARFGQVIIRMGDLLDGDLITASGDLDLRLGCFEINPVYDVVGGEPVLLRIGVKGVANIDGEVISIDDFRLQLGNFIAFDPNGLPRSGGIPIFSGNRRGEFPIGELGPCPGFGDVGDSSTADPVFSIPSTDPVTDACALISGQDGSGTAFEIETSWLKLLSGDLTPGAPEGCGASQ